MSTTEQDASPEKGSDEAPAEKKNTTEAPTPKPQESAPKEAAPKPQAVGNSAENPKQVDKKEEKKEEPKANNAPMPSGPGDEKDDKKGKKKASYEESMQELLSDLEDFVYGVNKQITDFLKQKGNAVLDAIKDTGPMKTLNKEWDRAKNDMDKMKAEFVNDVKNTVSDAAGKVMQAVADKVDKVEKFSQGVLGAAFEKAAKAVDELKAPTTPQQFQSKESNTAAPVAASDNASSANKDQAAELSAASTNDSSEKKNYDKDGKEIEPVPSTREPEPIKQSDSPSTSATPPPTGYPDKNATDQTSDATNAASSQPTADSKPDAQAPINASSSQSTADLQQAAQTPSQDATNASATKTAADNAGNTPSSSPQPTPSNTNVGLNNDGSKGYNGDAEAQTAKIAGNDEEGQNATEDTTVLGENMNTAGNQNENFFENPAASQLTELQKSEEPAAAPTQDNDVSSTADVAPQ
ncbi:MAG: hypothetical protein QM652_07270 [Legionella sp.]|uniref:hypothetical protein n=1 Tax=Legionella sp. TaxID=459 RepID=UPI0039E6582E